MKTAIVIPARIESTRFPEKMLAQVTKEHNLIQRVHHWCCCFHDTEDVYIATDSKRVAALFPDNSIMTSPECSNGTERISEAVVNSDKLSKYDSFVNVQGDMIDVPAVIDEVIDGLHHYDVNTVFTDLSPDRRDDPNSVKVTGHRGRAHYFARGLSGYGYHHLGIYGYRRRALHLYPVLDVTEPELVESLEQLRWIHNNIPVGMVYTDTHADEINTPEDLKRWQSTHQN